MSQQDNKTSEGESSKKVASENTVSEKEEQKIILGRITGVYGVKGWVKIFSYTDPIESIVDYNPWYLRSGIGRPENDHLEKGQPEKRKSAEWRKVQLKAGKRHAKTVVAKLEHCNDRDQAQLYIGSEVAIEQDQLELLSDKNEFYWRELIGLRVINRQGIELGKVVRILETGANDVLVVTLNEMTEADPGVVPGPDKPGVDNTGSDNKEHLIPWTMQQAIIAVDLEQGLIEVDWDPDF